jgi:ABC-type lipoprotein release transport system permease subunit
MTDINQNSGKTFLGRIFGDKTAIMFRMAFRNVFRQKRRSFITALAMFGGFTLASLAIGLADGSYNQIIDSFTRNNMGHIQIHGEGYLDRPTLYNTIDDFAFIENAVSGISGVEGCAPRVYSGGLASVGTKTFGVQIIGIDPKSENSALGFASKVKIGEMLPDKANHTALIGKGLAKSLNASAGDSIVIVSQAADGSIANDIYRISGIVDSGDEMSDRSSMFLHIENAQELFVLEGRIHEIIIVVEKIRKVASITADIRGVVDTSKYSVLPWQEFAKGFYDAMSADKQGNYITQLIIALIVGIGVLNTVLMSVLERTREYGVLKAVGTTPAQIIKLIMSEVFILASASVIVGAIISIIGNSILSKVGIDFGTEFTIGGFTMEKMFSEVSAGSLTLPTLMVLVTAIVVSVFPAIHAARTEPAKTMRM